MRDSAYARIKLETLRVSVAGYVIKLNDKQIVNDGGVKQKGSQ